MLTAQITRSGSHFDALHTRYDALERAMNDYSVASFEAAKDASLGYLDAAIREIVDNAQAELEVRGREQVYYEGVFAPHDRDL